MIDFAKVRLIFIGLIFREVVKYNDLSHFMDSWYFCKKIINNCYTVFYNLIIFYELVGGKQSYDLCGSLNLLICVGTLSTAFSIIEGANGFTIGNK